MRIVPKDGLLAEAIYLTGVRFAGNCVFQASAPTSIFMRFGWRICSVTRGMFGNELRGAMVIKEVGEASSTLPAAAATQRSLYRLRHSDSTLSCAAQDHHLPEASSCRTIEDVERLYHAVQLPVTRT